MQGNKAISTIVAVIAVMVVVSAVAIPVFDSMSESVYATTDNDGYAYTAEVYDASTYYKVEKTDDGISVNGVEYDMDTYVSDVLGGYSNSGNIAYVSDSTTLRVNVVDGQLRLFGIEGVTQTVYALDTTGSYIEWSNGTETIYIASTGATYTMAYTFLIAPEADGAWGVWTGSTGPWVTHGGSYYLFATGYPTESFANGVVRMTEGGNADVIRMSAVVDGTVSSVVSSVSITETIVSEGDRSAQIGLPTITYGDTSISASYNMVAPISYHIIGDSQQTLISIVDVIPLLIVVMVLIVAAYGVIRAKDE